MRSKNMMRLTNDIEAKRPGVVIYGKGDAAHATKISGHNEDDTAGVRAEDQDSDGVKEHRAIDVMTGPKFSDADAAKLFNDLTTKSENKKRLLYVIYKNKIRSRSNGWVEKPYDGEYHKHVHASGEADDDANEAHWVLGNWDNVPRPPVPLVVDGDPGPKTITRWQQIMKTPVDGKIDADHKSALILKVQARLKVTVDSRLIVDGDLGPATIAALQRYLKTPVTRKFDVTTVKALQRRLNENRF